jgi:TonB family protein
MVPTPTVPTLLLEIPQVPVPAPAARLASALPAPVLKTDNLTAVAAAPAPVIPAGIQTAGFPGAALQVALNQPPPAPQVTGGFGGASREATLAPPVAVARAGFGDVQLAALPKGSPPAGTSGVSGTTKPVEILAKPRPAYSEEARRLHVEGEVLIEILFTASGEARVIRLLRGLGHGLDENALAAARAIRFRPAEHAGTPVDSAATVHIVFQLAY